MIMIGLPLLHEVILESINELSYLHEQQSNKSSNVMITIMITI